jgi:hypothetical protein
MYVWMDGWMDGWIEGREGGREEAGERDGRCDLIDSEKIASEEVVLGLLKCTVKFSDPRHVTPTHTLIENGALCFPPCLPACHPSSSLPPSFP